MHFNSLISCLYLLRKYKDFSASVDRWWKLRMHHDLQNQKFCEHRYLKGKVKLGSRESQTEEKLS